ncbi:putative RNA methyltransferase-domain-containing protein [Ampelomyces quisqualis]|uniref:Putative RNA methyltransferase-domain-containing protein n=1 Tax=Ampelomyces quisqualis TaxID=50730 RepID=A0A6A5QCZ6_AMPQU|nr:putative RNA methyltransferase-domain-containing protein [Ampelomyces quisqualis]
MANDGENIVVNAKARSNKGDGQESDGAGKKRKASAVIIHQNSDNSSSPAKKMRADADDDLDTSRPTAIFRPTQGRQWTVSIALPGSWLINAKKPDHKTMQVGRIARAAAVFCVDEIVVFDDDPVNVDPKVVNQRYIRKKKNQTKQEILDSILEEDEPWQNPDQFLYHVLSFAECPPHLRMTLFSKHKNLEQAGMLPSMDMPHHLRSHEWCQFREGTVVGPASEVDEALEYAYVECGLPHPIRVPIPTGSTVEEGMRTTVRFASADPPSSWPHLSQAQCDALKATACANSLPREEAGYYWGYTVRRAPSLSAVFSECEFPSGYDYTMGTSERGVPIHSILPGNTTSSHNPVAHPFKHLLLVFGGVAGLEPAVANDPVLVEKGLGKGNAKDLFDAWVNLVPGQGSRTIRTEEAVEFGLCAVKPWVDSMSES